MMTEIKNIIKRMGMISPGTWVRLVLLVASLVNAALKIFGIDFLSGSSETVEKAVTVIVMVIVALTAYWKNNSFTDAALAADEIMKTIKK